MVGNMKQVKTDFKYIVVMVIIILGLFFSGCENTDPVSAVSTSKAISSSTGKQLKILKLGSGKHSLNKLHKKTAFFTKQSGGKVKLKFEEVQPNGEELEVEIEFEVLPGALNEDTELSLSMDTDELLGVVDVTFYPHGIVFNKPAILNIEVKGIDLYGINPADLDIYYDDQDNGQWEKMERDNITIDPVKKKIKVKNAKIPHFSRYALASD